MRHHKKPASGLGDQFEGQRQRGVAGGLVEVASWFIGQQQSRSGGQRPPDGDTLLLAARELFRITIYQSDEAETFRQPRQPVGIMAVGEPGLKGEIFANRQTGDQVELLKNDANRFAPHGRLAAFRQSRDIRAVEQDFAGVSVVQRTDNVQQSAFTAARFPHQGKSLAGFKSEVDAAQNWQGALGRGVGLAEPYNS